jgi:hypothetical protein
MGCEAKTTMATHTFSFNFDTEMGTGSLTCTTNLQPVYTEKFDDCSVVVLDFEMYRKYLGQSAAPVPTPMPGQHHHHH